jgi:hypothetical protein
MDFQGMRTRHRDRRLSLNLSTDRTTGEDRTGEEIARTAHRGDHPT